jgi:hypothetical protein
VAGDAPDPLKDKPHQITTSGDEALAIMRRSAAGEFTIYRMSVGKTPGQWVMQLGWPQPTEQNLL